MEIKEKIKELEKQIEELKKEVQKEEMEQWFKSLLNGLEIEIRADRQNSVYYKKNGKVFFELYQGFSELYQRSENMFYCDYDLVWSVFHYKYNFKYDETQAFVKSIVEQHLKLEAVTPIFSLILQR